MSLFIFLMTYQLRKTHPHLIFVCRGLYRVNNLYFSWNTSKTQKEYYLKETHKTWESHYSKRIFYT